MDNPTLMITGFVHVSIHCPDVMRQIVTRLIALTTKVTRLSRCLKIPIMIPVSLKLLGNLGVAEVVRR